MKLITLGRRPFSARSVWTLFKDSAPVALGLSALAAFGVFEYKDAQSPVQHTTARLSSLQYVPESTTRHYGPKGTSYTTTNPAQRHALFVLDNGLDVDVVVGPQTWARFQELVNSGQHQTTEFSANYKMGAVLPERVRFKDVDVQSARPKRGL